MRTISFKQAINEALYQEMERDERVFLVGEDIGKQGGDFGVTRGLLKKFGPDRVKDTPLSEAAILGVANGAAMVGMRPVAEIMFADFTTECYDQLVNNAAKVRYIYGGSIQAPIVVRMACGAGNRTGSQHSQNIEGWLMNVPGLVLVAPSNPYDAKGLLISSIRNNDPVVFFEHKKLYNMIGEVLEESYTVPLFKAGIKKSGDDITIISYMNMVHEALLASRDLEKEEIDVEIIDLRTLIPLDKETIYNSVRKTGRVVITYEAPKTGGLGAEIASLLAEYCFDDLKAPIKRVAALDTPVPFSPALEDYILPNKNDIYKAVKELIL